MTAYFRPYISFLVRMYTCLLGVIFVVQLIFFNNFLRYVLLFHFHVSCYSHRDYKGIIIYIGRHEPGPPYYIGNGAIYEDFWFHQVCSWWSRIIWVQKSVTPNGYSNSVRFVLKWSIIKHICHICNIPPSQYILLFYEIYGVCTSYTMFVSLR